jgi:hypothetical protein
LHARARVALALAASLPTAHARRARLLGEAERDAGAMARTDAWALPFADLLRAGATLARGDPERCLALLGRAEGGFEGAEMKLFGAATKVRIGQLIGGAKGSTLVHEADQWMLSQRIRHTDRMVATLAPGFLRVLA